MKKNRRIKRKITLSNQAWGCWKHSAINQEGMYRKCSNIKVRAIRILNNVYDGLRNSDGKIYAKWSMILWYGFQKHLLKEKQRDVVNDRYFKLAKKSISCYMYTNLKRRQRRCTCGAQGSQNKHRSSKTVYLIQIRGIRRTTKQIVCR